MCEAAGGALVTAEGPDEGEEVELVEDGAEETEDELWVADEADVLEEVAALVVAELVSEVEDADNASEVEDTEDADAREVVAVVKMSVSEVADEGPDVRVGVLDADGGAEKGSETGGGIPAMAWLRLGSV